MLSSSDASNKGLGLSRLKSSLMSGIASATTIASNSLSMNSSKHSKVIADDDVIAALNEMDYGDNGSRMSERDTIWEAFSLSVGKTEEAGLTIEKFVIDMLKRGHTPQWADAAFRTFDTKKAKALNKYEYLLAVVALKSSRDMYSNATWLKMRRRIVFSYYDHDEKGDLDGTAFDQLLQDLSTTTEDPEMFGIANKAWHRNQQVNLRNNAEHDNDSISQALALVKLDLAQKQEEFEKLQLEYIKLERFSCSLKLDLASTKALLDK